MTTATPSASTGYVQFRAEQLQLESGTPVGAGAISHVIQSELSGSYAGVPIVVKVLSKLQLLQQRKVESAMNEKEALLRLAPHPFIARLYGTAQSLDELYFVMEYLPHGDLLQHIRRTASRRLQDYSASVVEGTGGSGRDLATEVAATDVANKLPLNTHPTPVAAAASAAAAAAPAPATAAAATTTAAKVIPIPVSSRALRCLDFNDIRLITAQLVLALARTHQMGVVLRDLKPENVVFDGKYRACLIDFDTADLAGVACVPESNDGVALRPREGDSTSTSLPSTPAKRLTISEIQNMRKKTASFCGTAQYVSPEMVGECKWSFSSDLWALGTTVYEALYGVHMFSGSGPFAVLQRVVKGVTSAEHPVPFPEVDLEADCFVDADGREHFRDGGFASVKDFILRLVSIDPSRRLGVHPVSRGFDLESLKRHEMFAGFDWSVLELHLSTFKPRTFVCKGERTSDDRLSDPDLSPSLEHLYHLVPYNDSSYADYVYKATADANPFEQFMKHIVLHSVSEEERNALQEGEEQRSTFAAAPPAAMPCYSSTTPTTHSSASSEPPLRYSHHDDDDDDTMDVIDDVGMKYDGMEADEDFRQ